MGNFTYANPLVTGQPIINGQRVISAQYTLIAASTLSSNIPLTSDLIAVRFFQTGTITGDCSVTAECSFDNSAYAPLYVPDGAGGYAKFTATNAMLAATAHVSLPVKANYIRFRLTPGTMVGANGILVRVMD